MARFNAHPLAAALDRRIRDLVEETVRNTVRDEIRKTLGEELSGLLGGGAGAGAAAPAVAGPRRGRPPGRRPGRPAKVGRPPATGERRCEVVGCKRPYRSQGYCAAHYQAARKHGWPMPAPKNFQPPATPPRGRPAAAKAD
jgi:hypothetical protein